MYEFIHKFTKWKEFSIVKISIIWFKEYQRSMQSFIHPKIKISLNSLVKQ